MKKKKRVLFAFACLICFLVLSSITSYQVDAESENDTNDFNIVSIKEVNSSDQATSELNDAQRNDEKDGEDTSEQRINLLSVLLGGIIAIAGSVVTAIFNSLEASKQRRFQVSMATEERKRGTRKRTKIEQATSIYRIS